VIVGLGMGMGGHAERRAVQAPVPIGRRPDRPVGAELDLGKEWMNFNNAWLLQNRASMGRIDAGMCRSGAWSRIFDAGKNWNRVSMN